MKGWMSRFFAVLAAALFAFPVAANAATIINLGTFGPNASVHANGAFGAGPGTYKATLTLSTPVTFFTGMIIKTTTTNFFCQDTGAPEFNCGGDDVPTLNDLMPVNPLLYTVVFKVDPKMTVLTPNEFVTRTETFDSCCDFSLDFQSVEGGSYELSFAALGGVPEPATWMLAIMGMGAIGVAMRRRKPAFALA